MALALNDDELAALERPAACAAGSPVITSRADDALVAVLGLQIGMLAAKVSNLGLYRLGTSRINSPKSCAMGLAHSGISL